jgi:uncharacterized protein (TIGR03643 family)
MTSFALIAPEDSAVIRMAWEDRTTFDEIKTRTGLTEAQVIALMRSNLSASSFRMWRKRVHGRVTKHRQRLQQRLNPIDESADQLED